MRLSWAIWRAAMLAAPLALAGCLEAEPGKIAGDPDAAAGASADASPGAGDAGDPDAATCATIVEDDFNADSLDETAWTIIDEGEASIATIDQSNGELTIQLQLLPSDTSANIGVVSIEASTIAGTMLDVSLVQLGASAGARVGVAWTNDAGDYVAAYLLDGELVAARGNGSGDPPAPFCTAECPTYAVGDPDRVRLRANAMKIVVEVHDDDGWVAVGSTPNDLDGLKRVGLFTEGGMSDDAKGAFGEVIWACDPDPLP